MMAASWADEAAKGAQRLAAYVGDGLRGMKDVQAEPVRPPAIVGEARVPERPEVGRVRTHKVAAPKVKRPKHGSARRVSMLLLASLLMMRRWGRPSWSPRAK